MPIMSELFLKRPLNIYQTVLNKISADFKFARSGVSLKKRSAIKLSLSLSLKLSL